MNTPSYGALMEKWHWIEPHVDFWTETSACGRRQAERVRMSVKQALFTGVLFDHELRSILENCPLMIGGFAVWRHQTLRGHYYARYAPDTLDAPARPVHYREEAMTPERRRPQGFGWNIIEINKNYTAWQNGIYCALSSVVFISDEHLPPHWEWLISFSNMGKQRLSNKELKFCLNAFEANNFEEDNHEKGIARKFWLAIENQYRKPCPCKDEIIISEGDYNYSQTKNTKGARDA